MICFTEEMQMNKYKWLGLLFALAGICFAAGTVNHLLHTGEGVISSVLLALGCFCLAFAFYKRDR